MTRRLAILVLAAGALGAAPQRIVSTAPSITEMLYALGLGDRVVGVTPFCRYPPEAARKPKIGTYLQPDAESVMAQRPDLVVTEKTMARGTAALKRLGLKVLEVDDGNLGGIYESVRAIARAASVEPRGEALCARIRAEPTPFAVTRPLWSTVATDRLLDAQETEELAPAGDTAQLS